MRKPKPWEPVWAVSDTTLGNPMALAWDAKAQEFIEPITGLFAAIAIGEVVYWEPRHFGDPSADATAYVSVRGWRHA